MTKSSNHKQALVVQLKVSYNINQHYSSLPHSTHFNDYMDVSDVKINQSWARAGGMIKHV